MENNQPGNYDVERLKMVFTPRDLIKLHIRDLNHIVTDEDLRQLTISSDEPSYLLSSKKAIQESTLA